MQRCKCCGSPAPWFGRVDFARSCIRDAPQPLPPADIDVDYFRCAACGFLFSDIFDGWTTERLQGEVYNADYVRVDPDFVDARPAASAALVEQLFGAHKTALHILDYGGGSGGLARYLGERGFGRVQSADPFYGETAALPTGIDLMLAFEVAEHLVEPDGVFRDAAACLNESGLMLFSTLLQPSNITALGTGWWYIGPRNGHVSLHTRRSLECLAHRHGFAVSSLNDDLHLAWRRLPDFARHLVRSTLLPAKPALPETALDGVTRVAACRHGTMRFLPAGGAVDRSLELYGEYAEASVELFQRTVRDGAVVLDAGAHVGALTLPLARCAGPTGRVLAYEPQPLLCAILRHNLTHNGIAQAEPRQAALGRRVGSMRLPAIAGGLSLGTADGETVPVETIDGLELTRLDFVKLDVAGMAGDVLGGADRTIRTLRPLLYVENARRDDSPGLIAALQNLGYRLWWYKVRLFNPRNYAGRSEDLFRNIVIPHLFCLPSERNTVVEGLEPVAGAGDWWQ